jgi:uncharacterized protein YodC (DUF2158 family)
MSNAGLKRWWNGVRKASGIAWFNPSDTRHTAITRWAESGIDPDLITLWAGSMSPRMHAHYMQIASEVKQRRFGEVSKEVHNPTKLKNDHVLDTDELSRANESHVAKSEFQIGDVVSLKSGGPKMTVDEIRGNQAHCTWFMDGKREGSWFGAAIVKKEP